MKHFANLLAPTLFLLCSCSSGPKANWASIRGYIKTQYPGVQSISPNELAERMGDKGKRPILVDARQEDEFKVSHLEGALLVGSRLNIGERLRLAEAFDPSRVIVVYCSVGVRSASVAEQLATEGFSRVYNLDGSIFEWANKNMPLVHAGQPTTLVHPYNKDWGVLLDREHWSWGEPKED